MTSPGRRVLHRCMAAAAATALAAGASACNTSADPAGAPSPAAATAVDLPGDCGPVEYPPQQVPQHLIGDADPPGDYSSVPATSGWHSNEAPAAGVWHDNFAEQDLVAALEQGTVVLAIAPDVAEDTTAAGTVDDLLAQFPDRLVAVTYQRDMPSPVALLTWARLARCDTVDAASVTAFVLTHRVALGH